MHIRLLQSFNKKSNLKVRVIGRRSVAQMKLYHITSTFIRASSTVEPSVLAREIGFRVLSAKP